MKNSRIILFENKIVILNLNKIYRKRIERFYFKNNMLSSTRMKSALEMKTFLIFECLI